MIIWGLIFFKIFWYLVVFDVVIVIIVECNNILWLIFCFFFKYELCNFIKFCFFLLRRVFFFLWNSCIKYLYICYFWFIGSLDGFLIIFWNLCGVIIFLFRSFIFVIFVCFFNSILNVLLSWIFLVMDFIIELILYLIFENIILIL